MSEPMATNHFAVRAQQLGHGAEMAAEVWSIAPLFVSNHAEERLDLLEETLAERVAEARAEARFRDAIGFAPVRAR